MLRELKVARPAAADTAVVPPSVPLFGLAPIVTLTLLVAPVTRLPPAPRISTFTAGAIVTPPVVPVGCTRKPSATAGPTAMLNDVDVAVVSPVALAVRV